MIAVPANARLEPNNFWVPEFRCNQSEKRNYEVKLNCNCSDQNTRELKIETQK